MNRLSRNDQIKISYKAKNNDKNFKKEANYEEIKSSK